LTGQSWRFIIKNSPAAWTAAGALFSSLAVRRELLAMSQRSMLPCVLSAVALLALLLPAPVRAFTPESPEVKKLVEKAAKFLETAEDGRLGGKTIR
jgi:hypothetical protein